MYRVRAHFSNDYPSFDQIKSLNCIIEATYDYDVYVSVSEAILQPNTTIYALHLTVINACSMFIMSIVQQRRSIVIYIVPNTQKCFSSFNNLRLKSNRLILIYQTLLSTDKNIAPIAPIWTTEFDTYFRHTTSVWIECGLQNYRRIGSENECQRCTIMLQEMSSQWNAYAQHRKKKFASGTPSLILSHFHMRNQPHHGVGEAHMPHTTKTVSSAFERVAGISFSSIPENV